jgi:hypothetical protein
VVRSFQHSVVRLGLVGAALVALGCGFGGDRKDGSSGAPAPAKPLPAVDPCTLITEEEARPYVPEIFQQNRLGSSTAFGAQGQTCTYHPYANAVLDNAVVVIVADKPFTTDDIQKRVDKWIRGPEDSITALPDVGDLAYVAISKEFGEVWVLIGNRAMIVYVADKDDRFVKDASVTMAGLAASRFPRDAAGG